MATGAKASTTEQQYGFDDDERMAKAMPAAAIKGAMVAFVVRLVVCDGRGQKGIVCIVWAKEERVSDFDGSGGRGNRPPRGSVSWDLFWVSTIILYVHIIYQYEVYVH